MAGPDGGCKWNNNLAHEIFEENSVKLGKEKAFQLLRNDIQSWVRERDGRKFDWKLRVKDDQLKPETLDKSITGMIEDSISGPHSNTVTVDVKENAQLELATAQEVTTRAVKGEEIIRFPEQHRAADGSTVVRYFTVLTQDKNDATLYHGSRIDLGKNYSLEEAFRKVGEDAVMTDRDKSIVNLQKPTENLKPHYSSTHALIREVPITPFLVISGTVSEIGFTARSIQRYIERRKEKKAEKKRIKLDRKPVDVWKRFVEFGKKRIRKNVRRQSRRVVLKPEQPKIKQFFIERIISVQAKKSIEKSIARHERKVRKIKARKEQRQMMPQRTESKFERKAEVKRILRRNREVQVIFAEKMQSKRRKIAVAERREFSMRKIKKEVVRHARKEKVIRLFTLVRKLVRRKERMIVAGIKKTEVLSIRRAEKKRQVKEKVLDFSIAYIFWIFLTKPQNILMPARRRGGNEYKNSKKRSKELISKEASQWILLAIIWHLAMIRESGMRTVQNQTKQKKVKKKTNYPQFAPQGVIFAYAT